VITDGSPAILTCPIIGGFPSQTPHHPKTFDDVVRHGIDAVRAGAAVLHIHARTRAGEPTQDPRVYEEIAEAIRTEEPDVIVNYTTGGSPGMPEDERLGPLRARPELASLDCGTLNFGNHIFENSPAFIERAAAEMRDHGVKPEIECFEAGMVVAGARLVERGLIDSPPLFQFVLGVPGGAPARVDTLCHLVALLSPGAIWAAAAIGAPHFPLMAAALAMGGHIRTGMEDVAYAARGRYAETNAQLVERAVGLCGGHRRSRRRSRRPAGRTAYPDACSAHGVSLAAGIAARCRSAFAGAEHMVAVARLRLESQMSRHTRHHRLGSGRGSANAAPGEHGASAGARSGRERGTRLVSRKP
jgi:3-keto-5-aminohexanoate cleavage enzyme